MPYVDLAFRLTGSKVPVDHGYALYSAISRLLPEFHGAGKIGVHPIRGTYSGNGELLLRDSSRLVVRMESEQIGQSLKLAGKKLGGKGLRPLSFCLQWGAEAEVLEPKSLRRELQEAAERLLTLYGKMKYGGDKTQG